MPSNEGLRRQPPPGKVGGGRGGGGGFNVTSTEISWTGQEARKLDITEIKGVSYFARHGIIMYAARIVKFWLLT